jgi:DNA repair protein RadA/Sms
MSRSKTVYVCTDCGRESARWLGRCPACSAWNTLREQTVSTAPDRPSKNAGPPQLLSAIDADAQQRWRLSLDEFDRVLGGGLVPGSVALIGGEPGIGKSTLLLQVSAMAAGRGLVAYVSGEETCHQVKLRSRRLGIAGDGVYILSESNLDNVIEHLDNLKPGLVVIDSIQSVFISGIDSIPGSISQVRECTLRLVEWAKSNLVPLFITGHVTKDGSLAGPRLLEHMVDTVLYFEGEQSSSYRILRAVKNRFGSTSEVGIFEMKNSGLAEVKNPSSIFLSERQQDSVGSAVTTTLQGSRPLLVEIQALTSPNPFGQARRIANGVDFNRLLLITAVLGRRLGLKLVNQDIIANVIGGIRVNEPAADLSIALAIASSLKDVPVDPDMVIVGEIGLSGEIRAVPFLEKRIEDAARLGFKRAIVPRTGSKHLETSIEVVPVRTVREAVQRGLGKTEVRESAAFETG